MVIVEERCYVLYAQFSPRDYFDVYEELGKEVQTTTLGDLIGYFVTEVGELNAIVSLWRYQSFEDRQTRRQRLAENPQWRAYLDRVRPMILSMNNRLLTPVFPG